MSHDSAAIFQICRHTLTASSARCCHTPSQHIRQSLRSLGLITPCPASKLFRLKDYRRCLIGTQQSTVIHQHHPVAGIQTGRNPIHHQQPAHSHSQPELFIDLPDNRSKGRFPGFDNATGQFPVVLIRRLDQQHPAQLVDEQRARPHPLTRQPANILYRFRPHRAQHYPPEATARSAPRTRLTDHRSRHTPSPTAGTDPTVTSITILFILSQHEPRPRSRTPRWESAKSNATQTRPHTATAETRRIWITSAVLNGLPPHIAQIIAGHRDINVTMGYKAVYPEEAIQAHLAFLARRRSLRPSEEYRAPTEAEWEEFLGHFERRKVSLGTCGRAFSSPCAHEHACVKCALLWPDPAQRARLVEIRDNLIDRIAEAEREGWLGEVEGLKISLAGAEDKLTQLDRRTRTTTAPVDLGIPAPTTES